MIWFILNKQINKNVAILIIIITNIHLKPIFTLHSFRFFLVLILFCYCEEKDGKRVARVESFCGCLEEEEEEKNGRIE